MSSHIICDHPLTKTPQTIVHKKALPSLFIFNYSLFIILFKFKYQDHYFKKAKKEGYKARSAFKLEEIQEKFHLFDKNTKTILDIGCAPGSRIQYAVIQSKKNHISDYKILGVDIQDVTINLP